MVKERNIVVCILLTIITCGIYGIYWFIVMTDEASRINDSNMSGGMALLLTLVTCGLYSFYWYYRMGKELYSAGEKRGVTISDNSVIYLLLGIFGLGIVNYCMIQNDINKFAN